MTDACSRKDINSLTGDRKFLFNELPKRAGINAPATEKSIRNEHKKWFRQDGNDNQKLSGIFSLYMITINAIRLIRIIRISF